MYMCVYCSFTLPVIAAFLFIGFTLFLMASTIIVSLIPLYLKEKRVDSVSLSTEQNITVKLIGNTTLNAGPLNQKQIALLQDIVRSPHLEFQNILLLLFYLASTKIEF
jgi:hypothetical protein